MDIEQFPPACMLRLPRVARTFMPIQDQLPPGGISICQIDEKP
jgi:hypothetical protein